MKTILCFGDSNTYGESPEQFTPGGLAGRYPKQVRWTGLLQTQLGSDYEVLEEGLNGRTTVWEDEVEVGKSGKNQLRTCLSSHTPLDLVVLMLGTNDLKVRFHVTPADIAASAELLIQMIKAIPNDRRETPPKILLAAPPLLRSETFLGEIFGDRREDSARLGLLYREVALRNHVGFLNLADYADASALDGLHLDRENHQKVAAAMLEAVHKLLA